MIRKLKVLIIPSWYPTKENPIWGNYFIEQAKALSEYSDVSMLRINRVGLKNINTLLNEKKSDGYSNTLYPFKFYKHTILNLKSINIGLSFLLYAKYSYKAYKRYVKIIGKPDIILAQSVLPACFAVSTSVKNVIEDITKKDCKIIPNFIDISKFNIVDRKQRDTFNLISICNFFKVKALEILLESIRIIVYDKGINNIKLTIVGTGEYEEYYKKVSNELRLDAFVNFIGYVKNKDLPKIISAADVVCISSRVETFGIPLIEGMACGLPCISTDCGGPSEIINQENGMLVPMDDSESYAKAIIEMYTNYSKYNKKNIRQYVYEKYDKESVCKNIIDDFYNIIDKRK